MQPDDLIFAVTRAVHIGCALLLVSLPLFTTLIWRPAPAERGRHEAFCRNVVVLLAGLLAVEALTGAAWFWCVAKSMTDEPANWPSAADIGLVLTGTRFGVLWIVRAGMALMLAGLLAVGLALPRRPFGMTQWPALMLGIMLLGSLAFAGHAASGLHWEAWHLAVDMTHLLAGAVWPFGLGPLVLFLISAQAKRSVFNETDNAAVQRYSGCAFAAVFALLISGVANSWLMLPSWSALVTSTYGQLLLIKVLLVILMLVLGALNRYRFLPKLAQGAAPAMIRTVITESALAAGVIFIVGLMGITAPGPP